MRISRRPGGWLAVIAVLLSVAALAPGGATAASCTGNSHDLSLSDGTVTPGSGTTSTTFTFAVIYADSAGCPPERIVVVVESVGDVPMKHVGGDLAGGARFQAKLELPVGKLSYAFEATNGSGAGARSAKLKNVDPSFVIVSAPPLPPTPPPPADDPAPAPTAKPERTPSATRRLPDDDEPAPTRRPGSSDPSPSGEPAGPTRPPDGPRPSPTTDSAAGALPAGPATGDRDEALAITLPELPRPLLALVVASLGTVGGLVLFAFLSSGFADPVPSGALAALGRRRESTPSAEPEPER